MRDSQMTTAGFHFPSMFKNNKIKLELRADLAEHVQDTICAVLQAPD